MSRRGWRENFALAGWAVAALLGALVYSQWVADEFAFRHLRPDRKAHQATGAVEPGCRNGDSAELCVQRQAARAAERQADYAWWGMVLSATGLLGLFGTLIYTAHAASAASRAVEVAVASDLPRLRVSKLVFSRGGNADPRDNSKYAQVTIGFANYGGNAARVTRYCFELESAITLPDEPVYKSFRNVFCNQIVVAANDEYVFPPLPYLDGGGAQLAEVLSHKKRFWVYGYIVYLDHLDREHRTGFVAWWNHYGSGSDTFPDEATQRGETFNFMRKDQYTYAT
jgi:hypothetical protein